MREHIRIAKLVLAAREVTHLDEPEFDQGFQTIIHGAQAHAHPLPELALGEFRVLVEQTQDLEPRLFLDFRPVVQSLAETFTCATASPVQPTRLGRGGGVFKGEQG